MDLGIHWFVVCSTDILLVGHRGNGDFHTILVHHYHYAVDHCYSAINSFNISINIQKEKKMTKSN